MFKQLMMFILLSLLGYAMIVSNDFKVIGAGIAIFMVGMFFMEEGFKLFAGGMLESFLEKTTDTLSKAILSGFFVTSVVQSSSLVTVIAISFLSAGLIGLGQAIGIIFGSNIGTTTTAWIVAFFGLKIKIAYMAMPMLVFGVTLRFNNNTVAKGVGTVLLGLGFVFLGIGYMKEGFDTLKDGLDLAAFYVPGMWGILIYILLGTVATIVIQSSSATMAIIITALASGQIVYLNALALAIGANIGTTVTAVIGAMTSNENGRRLAAAHVIFNVITALIAVIFIYQFADLVDIVAKMAGIAEDDYTIKLAMFHTLFNLTGVLVVSPFTAKMVVVLQRYFVPKNVSMIRPKYLDDTVIAVPEAALAAMGKETQRLYDKAIKALTHGLLLHRHDVWSDRTMSEIVEQSRQRIPIDVDHYYRRHIKGLYGEIIKYSTMAQIHMDTRGQHRIYQYKLASRDIVEALKHVKELNKNILRYICSENPHIRREYNTIREKMGSLLREVERVRQKPNDILAATQIESIRVEMEKMDILTNDHIDEMVRKDKIDTEMATSLINDSSYAYAIAENLLEMATILWIEDPQIRGIELEEETEHDYS